VENPVENVQNPWKLGKQAVSQKLIVNQKYSFADEYFTNASKRLKNNA